jgi:small subunit ribosomal protein S1
MSRSEDQVWVDFVGAHSAGDVVRARVTKVVPFGVFVEVAEGIPGLLVGDTTPAVGESIPARIKEIDHEKRRLSLQSA